MKGDIVFVCFPYTDLTLAKPRPALVLHEERDEVVLADISSRVPSYSFRNRYLSSQ